MKLQMGVLDLPYADAPSTDGKGNKGKGSKTTGEVADILEKKYGIMEFFFEKHGDEIADYIAESYMDALDNIELGAPIGADPFAGAAAKTETMFRNMLMSKELDGQVAGVPTKASLQGQSLRKKKPYKKRKSRPSFINTGLYESSFRIWEEED